MTAFYTLCNEGDGQKKGEIIMKKSSFSGGEPIISSMHRSGTKDVWATQVTVSNLCSDDARCLLKLIDQAWKGARIRKNSESGEITVKIPQLKSIRRQIVQEDETFDKMVRIIDRQNNMFGVIASIEYHVCSEIRCTNCVFSGSNNDCLASKYSNYHEMIGKTFKQLDTEEED